MQVWELIDRLRQMPQNAPVLVESGLLREPVAALALDLEPDTVTIIPGPRLEKFRRSRHEVGEG